MLRRDLKLICNFTLGSLALIVSCVSSVGAAERARGSSLYLAGQSDNKPIPPREIITVAGGGQINTVVVDGRIEDVDGSVPPDDYQIRNKGVLNASGAVLNSVFVRSRGVANLQGSVVNDGVDVSNAFANIKNTIINGAPATGIGLTASLILTDEIYSSVVNLEGSSISAASVGVLAGTLSKVTLSNTEVVGVGGAKPSLLGVGATIVGGELVAIQGTYIEGVNQGVRITENTPPGFEVTNKLVVDSSTVRGLGGSAIYVNTREVDTSISIRNGANLVAGNNTLLEVNGSGVTNFAVDHSTLSGNLVADSTSTLKVTLQNNAQLTGNIVNGDTLAINSGAGWTLMDDNQVESLAMDGGRVGFGAGAFKTLTLNELSGRGIFDMRINLDQNQGDLLRVAGEAHGNHNLSVKNTGVEVVDPNMTPLMLVDTDGGDAQFSLVGGRADLGVYSYELEQQGDDWFIVGSGSVTSPSTQSVLALFNAGPNIWNSELSTLRSRMGEVRGQEQGGSWMRAYGSRFNARTGDGVEYRNNQSGLTLGVDAALPVSVGQLSVGLMAGYSKNDLAIGAGTSGKVGSYYVGGYGTWLLEDGYYLDAVLKLNRFRNESKVAMSDGARTKGNYESTGMGGSMEFGKHVRFAEGYFVEPYAQFSSVWVKGGSYALDNGMQARNNHSQSVLAKVGASAGRSITLKDGAVLRPYLRVAAAQEFARDNEVKVNKTRFDNDLFGSRAEVGAGVSVSLSERLQLHADFDYMKGKQVEQPWGANVGLKLAF